MRMGGSTRRFKKVNDWNSGIYSGSMDKKIKETYNNAIIQRKKHKNKY